MAHITRTLSPVDPDSDRWLMQTLVEHSSSDRAREAACAWLAAYDTALAFGAVAEEAHVQADAAYRVAATRSGLPGVDRRAA
jgi:hypothetical protein